ncbi:NAD(P)-dependent alcohol dehydrogenase [Anabaena cylindrica FACHB-243]|uniref:NADPH:quinone reductase n=1 Tax=Anabaena cylindrica (strain ATCC 27899 / PCC 7122) TaxID=272123 RepID=K9ZED6_ANACC|nr:MULTISPECIES: NAD(P)-dependent alcohol dehydrogenase [Anabaena]AFZ57578.1 NADPH:quinone reductase [Anabaena cylindrica PCC 7122]AZL96657.1 NADPH:quinone reductase [Anabaena sp. CCAP 1446/1C]MBD2418515.1 NAD(P)-dependent alcohol dehydrogenase [Anabaena cylindrica FACHB-243]MBY5284981.1 NAD(P)-dependent alcohol dehydrogenase [Anabaena sp. CCAP 1446/1C]MBY5307261.1 NAD(P)-dependent alcohol dehydrogenase [Anabaena sp. CCAP 1446/1C]
MKAVVIRRYGSAEVLQYEEVEQPKIKPEQLLVKVHASSVNPIDWKIRQGMLSLLTGNNFPMILGFDVAGEVVEVGSQVTRFQVGDAIYGSTSFPGGAYAEFAAIPENFAAPKPTNMSYEEAATVPLAALTALQALQDLGNIKLGQTVLINGASGGVGIFAVQIAKTLGAEVTGVCSTRNLDLVKSLNADLVIDYTQQDFTEGNVQYDIIFDAVAKRAFSNCRKVLKPNGVFISTLPNPEMILQSFLTMFMPGQKVKFVLERPNSKDLVYLKDLIEGGKMRTLIDSTYPLQDLAKAHRYSEGGRAVGKIAILTERIAIATLT